MRAATNSYTGVLLMASLLVGCEQDQTPATDSSSVGTFTKTSEADVLTEAREQPSGASGGQKPTGDGATFGEPKTLTDILEIAELEAAFNLDHGKPRLILIFSPT